MRAQTALSPVLAAHHTKCQTANGLLSAEMHGLYLAYTGPITMLKSVVTYGELVVTRHPERPGFRVYSE